MWLGLVLSNFFENALNELSTDQQLSLTTEYRLPSRELHISQPCSQYRELDDGL
jgi:hypothetical protein